MFTALEKVGLVCITLVGFQLTRVLLRLLYHNVIGPYLPSGIKLTEMGKWACVTGSTDGLGKAYAEALAKQGLNIVLISRSQTKLEAVASEIETTYNVQTKTVAVDFTEGEEIYHKIDKFLWGLEIGVLVNNVGMSYPYPEYFLQLPNSDKVYSNIIKCNIISVTSMCKLVMPQMLERGKGVVINVSSTTAQVPAPLLTVYSASKAFIEKFSADLSTEYSQRGIIVQCILPGYVATKMSKIHKASWMAPTPEVYVKSAIRSIGLDENTTGYFPHSMLVEVVHTLDSVSPRLSRWIVRRTMENIRSRALNRATNNMH